MKRITLFIITNLAIMLVLGTFVKITGLDNYAGEYGLNIKNLLIMTAIFGFGGSFFSLAISKIVAKWLMKITLINGNENANAKWLYETIEEKSQILKIKMPEIGVYQSNEMNAFATGPTKNNAIIAFSSELLEKMDKNELEGVIGHELAHISNGDMVTSTLLQGILNTFVLFISRVISFSIDKYFSGNNTDINKPGIAYVIITFILEIILGFLASIIVAYHSRRREFVADKISAELFGKENMISALKKINTQNKEFNETKISAFGINGKSKSVMSLFSTHPPINKRILALRTMK